MREQQRRPDATSKYLVGGVFVEAGNGHIYFFWRQKAGYLYFLSVNINDICISLPPQRLKDYSRSLQKCKSKLRSYLTYHIVLTYTYLWV